MLPEQLGIWLFIPAGINSVLFEHSDLNHGRFLSREVVGCWGGCSGKPRGDVGGKGAEQGCAWAPSPTAASSMALLERSRPGPASFSISFGSCSHTALTSSSQLTCIPGSPGASSTHPPAPPTTLPENALQIEPKGSARVGRAVWRHRRPLGVGTLPPCCFN